MAANGSTHGAGPAGEPHDLPTHDHTELAEERFPQWGRLRNSDLTRGGPWTRKIVLSLDGGGVRGYTSLLILEKLMEFVKEEENSPSRGSCKSSGAYSWFERRDQPIDAKRPWDNQFRPHHYFDYMVGTSTGGLTAMMLGRLRMTVPKAMSHYDEVGEEVFAHPRKFTAFGGVLRPKFKTRRMERTLQNITQQYRDELQIPNEDPSPSQAENKRHRKKARKIGDEQLRREAKSVRLRNDNFDAARTIVVAHGGNGPHEASLFRSYNHHPPNEKHTKESREKHYRPFAASNLPLWKIARATSAAPTYFRTIKIGDETYRDGAVAQANNPVEHAYDEVMQMHWGNEPVVIVSIGTGAKPEEDGSDQSTQKPSILPFVDQVSETLANRKIFQTAVLNSYETHLKFNKTVVKHNKKAAEDEKINYYRFDVPGDLTIPGNGKKARDLRIKDIKLGDWKGKDWPGSVTKKDMKEIVGKYLARKEVEDEMRNCAEKLVDIRRERQRTARWERYALILEYHCPRPNESCESRVFESRLELRQHLIKSHGFVWKVPCMETAENEDAAEPKPVVETKDAALRPYSCFWDQCGEEKVTVFKTLHSFKEHLRSEHHIEEPVVVTPEQFEDELDDGRRIDPPPTSRARTFGQQQVYNSY